MVACNARKYLQVTNAETLIYKQLAHVTGQWLFRLNVYTSGVYGRGGCMVGVNPPRDLTDEKFVITVVPYGSSSLNHI